MKTRTPSYRGCHFPLKSSATPTELVKNPGLLPTCPTGMVNFSQMWLMGQVERTA